MKSNTTNIFLLIMFCIILYIFSITYNPIIYSSAEYREQYHTNNLYKEYSIKNSKLDFEIDSLKKVKFKLLQELNQKDSLTKIKRGLN